MPSPTGCRIGFILFFGAVAVAALYSSGEVSATHQLQCLREVDQNPLRGWWASSFTCEAWTRNSTGMEVDATHYGEGSRRGDEKPFNFSSLFQNLVSIFLLCGECVILGAALFGGMVHFTPGVGLNASKSSSLASFMAVLSALGYHAVALGWYLGRLGVLHVVCFAPVFQALLTVAIALLYTAVMDLYNHADATSSGSSSSSHSFSPSDSISQRHSHRRARWC